MIYDFHTGLAFVHWDKMREQLIRSSIPSSNLEIPKVGNARLEVVGCPEECEVHGISKALGDDPRSVKVFCCPLYPRFCFSPAMYPGSCTGVFGGRISMCVLGYHLRK